MKLGNRSFADVDQLEKLVVHAATQYEAEGYAEDFSGEDISDVEYDELYRKLKELRPTSEAFIGTSPSKAAAKGSTIKHNPPMTSINKADGDAKEAIYHKWIADCASKVNTTPDKLEIAQAYKRDGVALRVNYVNGKLVSAGLRPRDGINGSDVTRHMPYIKGVPTSLPLPLTLSLNGEIECWHEDFAAVNAAKDAAGEGPYKNPRNYTAGCMGRDNPEENKDSRLRIAYYSITGFDQWELYYKTEIERAIWANSPDGLNLQENGKGFFVQVRSHLFKHLVMMEDHAKKLPYYTDGIVLKVNDLSFQEELGHTGDDVVNPPRSALAWKFKEEESEGEIASLEWNSSRTGRVVPTAILKTSVRLADTDVSRVTANNYGWVKNLGLGVGTIVKIKKAGKIIPKIIGVVSDQTSVVAPKQCPVCDSKLEITVNKDASDLVCNNPDCGAKKIQSWLFYIAKMGGKGLGASSFEKILATGKVKDLADLYEITLEDLMEGEFSDRQAVLALATIWGVTPEQDSSKLFKKIEEARGKKKEIEAWKFFAALGIPGAGETAGKALVNHYKDFEAIRTASSEELQKIAGIGTTTGKDIAGWFKFYKPLVDRLLTRVSLLLPKSGKMTGKNFCLTGAFDLGKKHWQAAIEMEGGNVQGSVGKTTHYLVQQHGKTDGSPSDKEVKAALNNVPIISVGDLKKLLS